MATETGSSFGPKGRERCGVGAVAGGAVAGARVCLFQQLGRVLALARTTRLVAVVGRGSRARQRRTCAIAHDASELS